MDIAEDAERKLILGTITSVKGSSAQVEIDVSTTRCRATVGTFIQIAVPDTSLIGMVTELRREPCSSDGQIVMEAGVSLLGEIAVDRLGNKDFRRGVSEYPVVGDEITIMNTDDLRLIFEAGPAERVHVGSLRQDRSINVSVDIENFISKHFAVLGSTGVGKSSGLAVILRRVIKEAANLRILLIDGHNEFGSSFGDDASIINSENLSLPFWLFNFDEIVDVFFSGLPPISDEVEILAELIPLAKSSYSQSRETSRKPTLKRTTAQNTGFTVDTPVPYVLQDLLALIDERMGRLENRSSRLHYHRLAARIEGIRFDPRYAFMFENANVGGDTMGDLLARLFRLDSASQPLSILQLAGLPSEVNDAVVCVVCRMAFDLGLWSEGAFPLLVVCEEAHRYAAADRSSGFNPARRAISRIAKEGRKYSIFLGLVTQRPAELDTTIISQCGTLLALRLANETDQALLRSALPDAAGSLLDFLPSLGTREVIGFGEGFSLPARFIFDELPDEFLPHPKTMGAGISADGCTDAGDRIGLAIERWRQASMVRSDSDLPTNQHRRSEEPKTLPGSATKGLKSGLLQSEPDLNRDTVPGHSRSASPISRF